MNSLPSEMLFLLMVVVFLSPSGIFGHPEEPPRCVFVPLKNCPSLLANFERLVQCTNNETLRLKQFIQDTTVNCCEITSCTDPMGLPGVCKSAWNCPALASQLTKDTWTQAVIQDMRQRKCVGPEESSRCCSQTNEKEANSSCLLSKLPILPDPTDGCCGISIFDTQDKIVGGTTAEMFQYPWMARILLDSGKKNKKKRINNYCSGVLISDRYVLSAAHCFPLKSKNKPIGVILGQYDTRYSDQNCEHKWCSTPITKGIEKIIRHENYYFEQKGLNHNDIALVRIDGPVAYSDNIRPICLPTSDRDYTEKKHRTNLIAAGWGRTDKENSTHRNNILQHKCRKYFANNGIVTCKQMCAGGAGLDTCKGDSGGPLMYESDDGYEVVGIVSLGSEQCGTMPGLYTKVYPYINWIIKHVNQQDQDDDNNYDDDY